MPPRNGDPPPVSLKVTMRTARVHQHGSPEDILPRLLLLFHFRDTRHQLEVVAVGLDVADTWKWQVWRKDKLI